MSIGSKASDVKSRRRSYDVTRRRDRARQAQDALLDTALRRFLADGYPATTIDSIAADVGVSSATVYKTFGGKPGLVRALCERALAGVGPVPAEERSDAFRQEESDPRRLIEGWGRLVEEVSPRVAPIMLLLHEAAGHDRDAAALYTELDGARLARMSVNARHLASARHLRAGLGFAHARDVLWFYTSPELFDLLVRRRGWSTRKYARFVADAIAETLL